MPSSGEKYYGGNDCFPEKKSNPKKVKEKSISYADYVQGIKQRGFDDFFIAGKRIKVDTTDFTKIDMENLLLQIAEWKKEILHN